VHTICLGRHNKQIQLNFVREEYEFGRNCSILLIHKIIRKEQKRNLNNSSDVKKRKFNGSI